MLANIITRLWQPWFVPSLVSTVFAIALVALVADATGGPGWGASSAHAVLAARVDLLASSPLYDQIAAAFALLPAGEPGFRLALLAALLGAWTLAGVVAAGRALLPSDPAAGVVGALLLALAPPFRDNAALASPAMLAAAGAVWTVALWIRFARAADTRDALGAIATCTLVIGSAPWLGAALLVVLVAWLARARLRRDLLAIAVGAVGLAIVLLWLGATGSLPPPHGALASLAASGRGAAAVVVGAGLLGGGFGALTGLPHARWLGLAIALAIAHEALVGGAAPAALALLAVGAAIVPSALVRVAAAGASGVTRHVATALAGVPLVVVAALVGATLHVDDPADAPAQLAHDLVASVPPGEGVFVATRRTSWLALQYERTVAGARPDLALVPPLPATRADVIVADALRDGRVVGADVAAFGRLDIRRAVPRGRGFQLVGEVPPAPTRVLPPPRYATEIGAEQAIVIALERARFEAANGRLDAAARAAGLEQRFGAADLAVLATTVPTKQRPALFGFLPIASERPGPWLLDTFGDDLAWVAGIEIPEADERAPIARRLHALWRKILLGTMTPDDPAIAALGPAAMTATRELFQPAAPR